ncbi:MAG: MFS transporter [Elusimicrobiales bacterium]
MIIEGRKNINPWFYVPTTYFAEGLPYVLVNTMVVVFYKKMNVSNDVIAFLTSWLFLPWTVKFLWGPVVDVFGTKRKWIIYTQMLMAAFVLFSSIFVSSSYFLAITLILFMAVAFLSATHDIAVDGFYMLSMDEKKQAFFVGIRAFFYRLAMLFSSSVLIIYAGRLESISSVASAWRIVFMIVSLILAVLFLYHAYILPFPEIDKPSKEFSWKDLLDAVASYFKQDKIFITVLFIIFYRFGEAMLLRIAPLFMLDPYSKGGLGLSTSQYGTVYGTFGLIFLIIGNIIGGVIIAKWGLKKSIWPMALFLNLPDLVYVYMAYHNTLSIYYIYILVSFEQFGYGLGTTAFMYYLIQQTGERYKTTHFAVSTSIMAMGLMVPGMLSGKLQLMMGYPSFFILVCLLTIPGMLLIPFLRYK